MWSIMSQRANEIWRPMLPQQQEKQNKKSETKYPW